MPAGVYGLIGFCTHVHTAALPGSAVFLHVPAFEFTVQALPPLHMVPPILVTQSPAAKNPAF
jgi:hypothetical protein